MKWETIKERVAEELYSEIIQGRRLEVMSSILLDMAFGPRPPEIKSVHYYDSWPVYAQKAHDVVMNWDVRCVGRLRELFPGEFPPSLRQGKLIAFMADNEDCDWMVEKAA